MIVEPRFETEKELKNLIMGIKLYDDSVFIILYEKWNKAWNDREEKPRGYVVFSKSYNSYDENALKEIRTFIDAYDLEIQGKRESDVEKLYFTFINHNW